MKYPYIEGDHIIIGPECFAAKDGSVLNWRGVNYTPQIEVLSEVESLRLHEILSRHNDNSPDARRARGLEPIRPAKRKAQ